MQSSRLLTILMLLQAHGRMTAPALARTLEVSQRTILRDVDALSAAGVPVWCERGRNGGFRLQAGWSTRLTGLTAEEVHGLFLAGLPGPATELGLGAAAAAAQLKMLAGLPPEWREQASALAQRLHIDPSDWYRSAETPGCLRAVANAVWSARRMQVRYRSWRRESRHCLDPLGLVLKAGTWYLVARSVGSSRIASYRLANVQEFSVVEEHFERPAGFDLARHWAESVASFETGLRRIEARLRVSPLGLERMRNLRMPILISESVRDPTSVENAIELRLSLESIEQGCLQLLTIGAEVEVLAPAELRQHLAEVAYKLYQAHRHSIPVQSS